MPAKRRGLTCTAWEISPATTGSMKPLRLCSAWRRLIQRSTWSLTTPDGCTPIMLWPMSDRRPIQTGITISRGPRCMAVYCQVDWPAMCMEPPPMMSPTLLNQRVGGPTSGRLWAIDRVATCNGWESSCSRKVRDTATCCLLPRISFRGKHRTANPTAWTVGHFSCARRTRISDYFTSRTRRVRREPPDGIREQRTGLSGSIHKPGNGTHPRCLTPMPEERYSYHRFLLEEKLQLLIGRRRLSRFRIESTTRHLPPTSSNKQPMSSKKHGCESATSRAQHVLPAH